MTASPLPAASTEWAAPEIRQTRAALSRVIEPGDLLAQVLIAELGPLEAYGRICASGGPGDALQQRVGETAETAGLSARQRRLTDALPRWRARLRQVQGPRDLRSMQQLGGGLIIPEDSAWPAALNDLGPMAPTALWFRAGPREGTSGAEGDPYERFLRRMPPHHRAIGIVGSREMTDYGGRVAVQLSSELAGRDVCILSGGAYGVDAAAHRGALKAQAPSERAPTIAVLAGGLDRWYPAGNEPLLRGIGNTGLLLSEMAPGSSPTKHRFLHRNRMIAALAAATVVVEARRRSGALSTAHHALGLGRPVGVVPGSVFSASSEGCHRLLRDSPAQVITDAADILHLLLPDGGALSTGSADEPQNTAEAVCTTQREQLDALGEVDQRVWDALPARRFTSVGKLSEVAGLAVPQVLGGLNRMQTLGLVIRRNGHWGRAR
ncbi:DNA-processing protein DprA [Nesterenkonia flava]|uniref:DNA-processing protein DprA n=1 Tax=Nesterenkonia flava TaxID=469799 RepID=A0ABU1FSU7_9MICC|nr:DNA-processing protein DprA [Nesterenkonia flava]MDR5711709.1 DNA-processing protein DprA [Nesterenkonia flava]